MFMALLGHDLNLTERHVSSCGESEFGRQKLAIILPGRSQSLFSAALGNPAIVMKRWPIKPKSSKWAAHLGLRLGYHTAKQDMAERDVLFKPRPPLLVFLC